MQLLSQEQSRHVSGGTTICRCAQQHAQGTGLTLPGAQVQPGSSTCLMGDTVELDNAWSA